MSNINDRNVYLVRYFAEFKKRSYQFIPPVLGYLLPLSYGIMLGWPSPFFIKLFEPDAEIPVPFGIAPLLAGTLMFGGIIGSCFSTLSLVRPKYYVILANSFVTAGWLVLWQAENIVWLFVSRLLIGYGNGFGYDQLKNYILDLCYDNRLSIILVKATNTTIFVGVLIAYSMGPFVELSTFSLVGAGVSFIGLVVNCVLPKTLKELQLEGRVRETGKLLVLLKPTVNLPVELEKLSEEVKVVNDARLHHLFTRREYRKHFFIMLIMVFVQQFSGSPATIVFSQFIFLHYNCPNSEYLAMVYMALLILTNMFANFVLMLKFNKKYCLLFSGVATTLILIINFILLYFGAIEAWPYTAAIIMYLYIIFHTVGLHIFTPAICLKLFPLKYKSRVSHFYWMLFCLYAILVTKMFQVLFISFYFYGPIYLFLTVALLGTLFTYFFVPDDDKLMLIRTADSR